MPSKVQHHPIHIFDCKQSTLDSFGWILMLFVPLCKCLNFWIQWRVYATYNLHCSFVWKQRRDSFYLLESVANHVQKWRFASTIRARDKGYWIREIKGNILNDILNLNEQLSKKKLALSIVNSRIKKLEEKWKIVKRFGNLKNYIYLCIVKQFKN